MKSLPSLFLLLILGFHLHGQTDSLPEAVALVNGTLIKGDGSPALEGYSILIRGDRIVEISKKIDLPAGARIIDCSGQSILPGLIDMHGHLYGNTGMAIENQFNAYPKLYLAGGVTTIFSPGEFDPEGAIALRDQVNAGEKVGPRILTAGPYFDQEPSKIPWINGVKTEEEALAKFRDWKNRIDGVKFYTSITKEQMRTVLVEARDAGLLTTGHLASVPAGAAIEMGISGLEHGIFGMSEFWPEGVEREERMCALAKLDMQSAEVKKMIRLIVDNNIYIDPTIVVMEGLFPDFEPVTVDWEDYLSEKTVLSYRQAFGNLYQDTSKMACEVQAVRNQFKFIKALYEAGGIIVTGTDPIPVNLIPGYALHREMANLVKSGVPRLEAIKAATLNAARALNLEDEIGTLVAGKRADIVLVSGRPDQDIDDVGKTRLVIKGGTIYHPDELRVSVKGMIGRRSTGLLIGDMLAASQKIFDYIDGIGEQEFAADEKTKDAVLKNLLILGEACSQVPKAYEDAHPDIPWQTVSSFKHYILGPYYEVKAEQFWWFLNNGLPKINANLKQIRSEE